MATMFPMMEMAGQRFRFLDEVLYVYNDGNPMCDFKAFSKEQLECERRIRKLPPYSPVTR